MSNTALVKVEQAVMVPIKSVGALLERINEVREHVNLIMPMQVVPVIPPLRAVALNIVVIDSAVNAKGQGREVYRDQRFCEDDEVAFGKIALLKFMGAAGITVASSHRIDDVKDPNYVNWPVTLEGEDLTGMPMRNTASKEVDLRDGAPDTMKPEYDERLKRRTGKLVAMDATAVADKRRHIQSNAETKALLRCLRSFPHLAIPQKVKVKELAKPYLIPRLVADLDPNHPGDRELLARQAMGLNRRLYGEPSSHAAPALAAAPAGAVIETTVVGDDTPDGDQRETGGATKETPDSAPDREGGDQLDLLDVNDPPAAAKVAVPIFHCGCPCGHQVEVEQDLAEDTKRKYDSVRCRDCAPSKSFNFAKHKDLRGGLLQLPKSPSLTVDGLRKKLEEAAAAAGKR